MMQLGRYIRTFIKEHGWILALGAAMVILTIGALTARRLDYSSLTARHATARVNARISRLDGWMRQAMASRHSSWLDFSKMPDDMIVYRYVNDSLQSWANRFPVENDDISRRLYFPSISPTRQTSRSPLFWADSLPSLVDMGGNLFIIKSIRDNKGCEVIGGLEIQGHSFSRYRNSTNPKLGILGNYSIHPMSSTGGAIVKVQGVPLFRILQENLKVPPIVPDNVSLCAVVLLLALAVIVFARRHRRITHLAGTSVFWTIICIAFWFFGKRLDTTGSMMFSPIIYADGAFFYSLGALMLTNLWILVLALLVYTYRLPVFRHIIGSPNPKTRRAIYVTTLLLSAAAIVVYVWFTLSSVIHNSSIALALFKGVWMDKYTVLIFISYTFLLVSVPALLQCLRPYIHKMFGTPFRPLSLPGKMAFSVLAAAFLMVYSSALCFQRERTRAAIWANRLSIERNLGFELQLRRLEVPLTMDPVLTMPLSNVQDYNIAVDRMSENLFGRISQDYDVSLYVSPAGRDDPSVSSFFENRIHDAVPIADGSCFLYSRSPVGRAQYTAIISSVNKLYVSITSKAEREARGFSYLLGPRGTQEVLPTEYSYAKYQDHRLLSSKGDCSYPTVMTGKILEANDEGRLKPVRAKDYVHFINHITVDETIVISRKKESLTQYMVLSFSIILLCFLGLTMLTIHRRSPDRGFFDRNYYKTRINVVLFLSLTSSLVVMTVFSIAFVYRKNNDNVMNLMKSKLSTISTLVESVSRYVNSDNDFASNEIGLALDNFSQYTNTDISIYSVDGRFLRSTSSDVRDKFIRGMRMDETAFASIVRDHESFIIQKERIFGHSFYAMYAPVFNDAGKMVGIVESPYTDSGLEFRREAILHSLFLVTLFMLLLFFTRFFSSALINRMFRPIVSIGKRMSDTNEKGLEYIIYDRDDEISSLVRAYNLMVHDLSESTKQMAQVERDKAWSEMARQVAHEIKNPMTPIKLSIQRIIRLKKLNRPDWEEKFDEIVPTILESIDNLTDTANEFSTFAKLYSQEPVLINLDELAREQLSLFESQEEIDFQYIGLPDSMVMGPKPQLTRVFVNLITNAVQAIINSRANNADPASSAGAGSPASSDADVRDGKGKQERGIVFLSVRNSSRDGFYDIVFEDNGPGVSDANRGNLFTPNFTTKSSGTGLGLAICKNILERCGGEIFYSKSFALGGACFTVRFPKKQG